MTKTVAEIASKKTAETTTEIVHGTCVCAGGRGALITGASGSGKSSLALALIGLGADLVADDRVVLSNQGTRIEARAPGPISNRIEARGIGVLRISSIPAAFIDVVVDMDRVETERMPGPRETRLLGQSRPLLRRVDNPYFPSLLMQFLKAGRDGQDI